MATQYVIPDLATQLQGKIAGLSRPDDVLCRFIRIINIKRQNIGLTAKEAQDLCRLAIKIFTETPHPDTQAKCVHLITATRSKTAIDVLETGLSHAHGDWIKQVIRDGIDELVRVLEYS